MDKPGDVLTSGEAAVLCGISRSTLRRAVRFGHIAAWHTPGGHLRFSRAACVDFARSLGQMELVGRVQERAHAEVPGLQGAAAPR
jgi:excisionase family DNA binding protein